MKECQPCEIDSLSLHAMDSEQIAEKLCLQAAQKDSEARARVFVVRCSYARVLQRLELFEHVERLEQVLVVSIIRGSLLMKRIA